MDVREASRGNKVGGVGADLGSVKIGAGDGERAVGQAATPPTKAKKKVNKLYQVEKRGDGRFLRTSEGTELCYAWNSPRWDSAHVAPTGGRAALPTVALSRPRWDRTHEAPGGGGRTPSNAQRPPVCVAHFRGLCVCPLHPPSQVTCRGALPFHT